MVAEGGRYKSSSSASGRRPSSGHYGSTSHLDLSSSTSHLPGASSAPVFGQIRITQSVERDFRSGGLGVGGGGGPYTGGSLSTAAAAGTPSHGRRFSLSTDRIITRDKALHTTTSTGGLKPLHHHHPPTPYLQRRASIASYTPRPRNAFANHHLLATDGDDDDDDVAGALDQHATYSYRPYSSATAGSVSASSTVSSRGTSVRASSVSKYDSQSNESGYNGRAPSVSRYEGQSSFYVRSPSVSRYDAPISNGRAPSLSRYESHTPRATSISRYDSQSSLTTRAPSVSRYDGYASTPRAPSVSRYEGYGSTPRAPSVSPYEGYGSTPRAPSVSRYEGYSSTPRPPSVPRYESQSTAARAPSVSRYEGYVSTQRAPSVSRYESQVPIARAPSVSPYEGHGSTARAPSVSRYEGYASTSRAPSVSRYESQPPVKHRFRSASVSRYERSTRFTASDADEPYLDYPTGTTTARTVSTSRSSEHLVDGTSNSSTGDGDDDAGYQLRRQLRAMRNQQVRGGSVARHEITGRQSMDPHVVVTHHHETAPIRPRSLSISSHVRDSAQQRRYKVLTVQSPVRVPSPASATTTLHTGYPEPTLYSAKVFQNHDVAHANVDGTNVTAINSESAFIDNREDITSFVLKPGEKFLPTDVSVHMLPSGKKAVTYTQFSQKGTGDQRSANEQIERIISKTKMLQEQMHTLEDFVKRNRSLFPEDIIIYQKIVFYLLSEAELVKMGERPDAEIYGVKIRERLVAPTGTDVASILKRFYSRHTEVDVEYEHVDVIRRQLQESEMEAAASGKRPTPSPRRARHFQDELDLERQQPGGHLPQSWHPAKRSRSSELYIDEEELLRRDGMANSPRRSGQQRPSAPEFTHRLRGQRAAVGQSVRLSCTVSAFPDPVITWYRGKQEITQNGRFSVKHNNYSGLCTLTISDLTPEDGVLYTVKAVNSEGETATSGLLEVYENLPENASPYPAAQRQAGQTGQTGPTRRRSTEPIGTAAAGAAGRRPFFLLEARNLWADVGEKASFEVQAAGKPLPSFTWVRDDCPLTAEDDRIHMESDGYGNCKLVIREIRESDFGTYRCLAQNEDGTIESIASLFCVGNESLRPGQAIRDELLSSAGQHRGRKPTFVFAPPSRIDVIEGEPLTLQCTVDGDPKPLITWYKGVRELTYTGRHRVLEERNSCYVMQLKSTLATDSGEYTVTAHNLCGLAESIVYVNVLPAERALDDFDPNWKRLEFTPLDYELVTKTRQGKMPPIFVKKLPREKQFKVGESLKFDCLIEVTKPREYLVDVDIVLKGEKKDDTAPPRRTETKYERKVLLDAVKPQQQRTSSPSDNIGVQERSRSKENVPTAQPTQPSSFNVKTDKDVVKSSQPSHAADRGIVQLAENLARQISNDAVEETVQQQQQQQQQQQEEEPHDSIIRQRNADHELKAEDQERIPSRKVDEVSEVSDFKIDDKETEIKSEDTPTEIKAEDTEIEAEDTPIETKPEDTPTETKAEDAPTEIKSEEAPTEIKSEDVPTKTKAEDTPAEINAEDAPTETKPEEAPTEIKAEDTPAEVKSEDAPTETKSEETPTEAKAEDAPTETIAEDAPAEVKSEDAPTETKAEETPTETKSEETPTETKAEDAPTETKSEDAQTEIKAEDTPTEIEAKDTPTETKAEDAPAEIKTEDAPTETKSEDTPTETKSEDAPTEIKSEDTKTETTSEDAPTEIKSEDTKTETKSEDAPTEIKSENTAPDTEAAPTESKSSDVSTVAQMEEEEEKPVIVVKVTESGASAESTETVLKAEATPTVTAELGTGDEKDHDEEEKEEEEEEEESSEESRLSSSESESESD